MSAKHARLSKPIWSWAIAVTMVTTLALTGVTPASAAACSNTVASISVGSQSGSLTYGSPATATFVVTVTSTGPACKVSVGFSATGLPAGTTKSFSPKSLSFTGVQTLTTLLTIKTSATTPPGTPSFRVKNNKNSVSGIGTLTVNKATLHVTGITANDKVYDGLTTASLNTVGAALTGIVGTDIVTLVTTSAVGTFDSKDVGLRNVTVSGLTLGGSAAWKYTLVQPSTTANITKATLKVTANPAFIVVGFPDPTFTFAYDGFVNGETSAVIATPPTCSVPAPHGAPGTFAIVCSGGVDENYAFTYVDGTLTVSPVNALPTNILLSKTKVLENLPAGSTVGTLTTVDADSSLGETYSYTLPTAVLGCDGTDNGSFQFGVLPSGAWTLQTRAKFHYVTKTSLSICIETNDHNGGTLDKHFTITVLPSTMTLRSTASYDGWILESTETSGVGGTLNVTAGTLRVGDDASNKQYRSVLHFATANIPDTAVILNVVIKVKSPGGINTANIFTALQGLRVDIKKPAYGTPALALGDFQALPGITGKNLVGSFGKTPVSGWYTARLYKTAFPYLNKTGSTQIRLRFFLDDNNNHIANYLSLYSGNATYSARPILTVTYSVP